MISIGSAPRGHRVGDLGPELDQPLRADLLDRRDHDVRVGVGQRPREHAARDRAAQPGRGLERQLANIRIAILHGGQQERQRLLATAEQRDHLVAEERVLAAEQPDRADQRCLGADPAEGVDDGLPHLALGLDREAGEQRPDRGGDPAVAQVLGGVAALDRVDVGEVRDLAGVSRGDGHSARRTSRVIS